MAPSTHPAERKFEEAFEACDFKGIVKHGFDYAKALSKEGMQYEAYWVYVFGFHAAKDLDDRRGQLDYFLAACKHCKVDPEAFYITPHDVLWSYMRVGKIRQFWPPVPVAEECLVKGYLKLNKTGWRKGRVFPPLPGKINVPPPPPDWPLCSDCKAIIMKKADTLEWRVSADSQCKTCKGFGFI